MTDLANRAKEAILFTRPDCSLCFVLKRSAARAARRASVRLREVDVSLDRDLMARYGNEVPVLILPGGRSLRGGASGAEIELAFREAADGARRGSAGPAIVAVARARLSWLARIRRALRLGEEARR